MMLSQKGADEIQFIFVHDQRENEPSECLRALIKEFPHLKITFLAERYGAAGSSRNAGLAVSEAEWVAFCDADDAIDIQRILNLLKVNPIAELIVGQFVRTTNRGETRNSLMTRGMKDIYIDPGFWRMIYKKNLISNIQFTNLKMGEDIVFLADVIRKSPAIAFYDDLIYKYVIGHPLQSTANPANYDDLILAIEIIKERNPHWRTCQSDAGFLMRLCLSLLRIKNKSRQFKATSTLGNLFIQNPRLIVSIMLTLRKKFSLK